MSFLLKFFPALAPYEAAAKIAFYIATIAAIFGTGVYVARDHYLAKIETMRADYESAYTEAVNLQLAEIQAHQTDVTNSENQHATDQLTINDFAFRAASMRVHIPIRGGTSDQRNTAGSDTNRAGGVFSAGVDKLFADLQGRIGSLIERCDQLNIDARQFNVEVGNMP